VAGAVIRTPPEAGGDQLAGDVEDEGQDEQEQPDREEGIVGRGAARLFPGEDADDGAGHRLHLAERVAVGGRLRAGGEGDDHRLADGDGDGEDGGGDDAGEGGREDDAEGDLEFGGAERVASLAEGAGTARMASSEREATSGMIKMPTAMPPVRPFWGATSGKMRRVNSGVMKVRAK
jgi:hypothetical protein